MPYQFGLVGLRKLTSCIDNDDTCPALAHLYDLSSRRARCSLKIIPPISMRCISINNTSGTSSPMKRSRQHRLALVYIPVFWTSGMSYMAYIYKKPASGTLLSRYDGITCGERSTAPKNQELLSDKYDLRKDSPLLINSDRDIKIVSSRTSACTFAIICWTNIPIYSQAFLTQLLMNSERQQNYNTRNRGEGFVSPSMNAPPYPIPDEQSGQYNLMVSYGLHIDDYLASACLFR